MVEFVYGLVSVLLGVVTVQLTPATVSPPLSLSPWKRMTVVKGHFTDLVELLC